jgi:ABC-type Mn2+/Zn2+ transport system permease subunit
MLWVSWPLVIVTVLVYLALSLFHYRYRDRFIAITESPGALHRENYWDLLFFISLGVITVLIVPIAGVLLAYGFLMIPAAIATLFTRNWRNALLLGWGIGFSASLAVLFSSYSFNLPYGPTLVLMLGVFFFAALVIKCFMSRKSRGFEE